ncbi:hypothetical protein CupriaWKF_26670 [Cupriavidus sp. WKF15]|uniref:hypothetical protein n=1 Tax=Cupriavidus sp. WKF15 TaxID=3032282 RepID=UPI0023E249D4|nr:hypothetical protein [Cupriavidus sp. WKF15]WER48373.1 hypothetical protein CupriaWKF_26670 [Cupriavidus sp. WKF15]
MTQQSHQSPAAPDKGEALGRTVLSVARHRSLGHLTLSSTTLAGIVLLPVLFNVVEWQLRIPLSTAWTAIFGFWLKRLEIAGVVSERLTSMAWFDMPLPHVEVVASLPDGVTWLVAAALTILVCLVALRLSDKYLPLRYLLLFAVFIQVTALIFFGVVPERFPYTASGYVDNGLKTAVSFLLLLPWAHALVYYIFDFSWSRKIGLTMMTLTFVVVAVPLQLMLHVYVMCRWSLLCLPLLSFLLGPSMILFGCIALYGWAMSWQSLGRGARACERSA